MSLDTLSTGYDPLINRTTVQGGSIGAVQVDASYEDLFMCRIYVPYTSAPDIQCPILSINSDFKERADYVWAGTNIDEAVDERMVRSQHSLNQVFMHDEAFVDKIDAGSRMRMVTHDRGSSMLKFGTVIM